MKSAYSKFALFILWVGLITPLTLATAQVEAPESFIGFRVGEDRKLVGWQTMVDYLRSLDVSSERLSVIELGKSTLGQPVIMAIISSPLNMMNQVRYQNLQKQAANPRRLSEEDVRLLARQNKAVVMLAMNLDVADIASSQASLELAYFLATDNSERTQRIRENCIILLIPSPNPDGLQALVDWYEHHLGTPHEGSLPPNTGHYYAGKQSNRDWLAMRLIETRLLAQPLFQKWYPHIVVAIEQGKVDGPRLQLPPYRPVANPNMHPLLMERVNAFGANVYDDLCRQGLAGVASGGMRASEWRTSLAGITWWHNRLGIVLQVPGVQVATQLFFPQGSLKGAGLQNQEMAKCEQTWTRGWWRLRDCIDYQLAACLAILDRVAQNKEAIIYDFCKMNLEALIDGRERPPFAYVIPKTQHDPPTSTQFLRTLQQAGIEIQQAQTDFNSGGRRFLAGSHVVSLSQATRPWILEIMEPHPDANENNGATDGRSEPEPLSLLSLPHLMGVEVVRAETPIVAELVPVSEIKAPEGGLVAAEGGGYLISRQTNESSVLINYLLKQGKKVYCIPERLHHGGIELQPGALYIPHQEAKSIEMQRLAQRLGITILQTTERLKGRPVFRLKSAKLGLYQPFVDNADPGWTRLLLDNFDFAYKLIHNPGIKNDDLKSDYDVLVLPDIRTEQLLAGNRRDVYARLTPEPYTGGIGEKGAQNLRRFVVEGGTLIALNRACEFAVDLLGLPLQLYPDSAEGNHENRMEALLSITVDASAPQAYGMPDRAAAVFHSSPVLAPIPWHEKTEVGAYYSQSQPLLSDSLPSQSDLAGLPAVLELPVGKGKVVLIGFKAQHMALTAATFKLLFNAIHMSTAEQRVLEK